MVPDGAKSNPQAYRARSVRANSQDRRRPDRCRSHETISAQAGFTLIAGAGSVGFEIEDSAQAHGPGRSARTYACSHDIEEHRRVCAPRALKGRGSLEIECALATQHATSEHAVSGDENAACDSGVLTGLLRSGVDFKRALQQAGERSLQAETDCFAVGVSR